MNCLFIFFLKLTQAQFAPATHFLYQTANQCYNGPITDVVNTGNDARDMKGIYGLDDIKVNVWDGTNPGLGWNYNGGIVQCHMSLPAFTIDPDVVLLMDEALNQTGYTYYAVVVYQNSFNGDNFCDIFEWDKANQTFSTSGFSSHTKINIGTGTGRFSSINIDALDDNYFAIVWDDFLGSGIWAMNGNGPLPANLSPAFKYFQNGYQPDVAILGYFNLTPPYQNVQIYVTYLDNGGSTVLVDECSKSSFGLFTNSFANHFGHLIPNTHVYGHPRIACPPQTLCGKEWTVVLEDQTTNDILSINLSCSSSSKNDLKAIYYTDGGLNSPQLINTSQNTLPAIAYDESYTYKMVGWQTYYQVPNIQPPTILAMNCNLDGTRATACSPNYLIVPILSHYDDEYLSISGRYYPKMLYTYYEVGSQDIMYKEVISCTTSLKRGKPVVNNGSSNGGLKATMIYVFGDKINLNPYLSDGECYQINLVNLAGSFFQINGNCSELNRQLEEMLDKKPGGLYVLKISNAAEGQEIGSIHLYSIR